jgi:hypothetical protein
MSEPQGVGWVERSEPHHLSGQFSRWGSLRSTHPTSPIEVPQNRSRLMKAIHTKPSACRRIVPATAH